MYSIKRYLRNRQPLVLLLFLCITLAWLSTSVSADRRSYTQEDAELIAQTLWGEARSCDLTHQAAVAWCILNRVDSTAFPNTIREVVIQKYQFAGYHAGNPVEPELLALAYDVLARWSIEPECVGSVSRVLPKEYLYFGGNGTVNQFRTKYVGGTVWDWSLDSPYQAENGKREIRPEIRAGFPKGEQNEKEISIA